MESENSRDSASHIAAKRRRRARWEAVVLSVIAMLVVGAAILGLWLSSQKSAYEDFRAHLVELAEEAATTIDPVLHEQIRRPEQLNGVEYVRAVEPLRRLRKAVPTIRFAYTLVREANRAHFVLDAADPDARGPSGKLDQSGVWEVYEHWNPVLAAALGDGLVAGIPTSSPEIGYDEWGSTMSGFAPIRDASGHQIAALGLDVDADVFAERLAGFRNRALVGLAPAGVLIVLVGVIFYRVRCRGLEDADAALANAAEAMRAAEVLDTERRRLREVIEGTSVGMWEWNSRTRVIAVSDRTEALLGFAPGALRVVTSARRRTLIHPEDFARLKQIVGESLRSSGTFFSHEFRMRHADGHWVWTLARGKVLQSHGERRPQLIAGIVMDVSARKGLESALIRAAQEDRLTGLPNRAVFMEHLELALNRVRCGKQSGCAVLFFDFDRFKLVNDTLGHEGGDELLRQISQRLSAVLRVGDYRAEDAASNLISRFGGDEFLVLLNDLRSPGDAVRVAERLLNALATRYEVFGHEVHSMASVGIVTGDRCTGSAEEVVRNADVAMYEAKRAGRGCSVVFNESLHARMIRHLAIETSLRRAIGADELYLVYAPVVELHSGRRSYVEAVLHWNHPTMGLIEPQEFLPIAEESGLIVALGRWMLEEACRAMARWRRSSAQSAPTMVSLTISRFELNATDRLIEHIRGALQSAALPARCLQIEVSERDLMQDHATVSRLMRQLRELGVRLALRDFGAGHCSLSVLGELPFDTIKIDRSFAKDIQAGHAALAVIGATLSLIRNLRRVSVADGVENSSQVALLQSLGCDCGGGILFGEPLLADQM